MLQKNGDIVPREEKVMWPITATGLVLGSMICTLKQALCPQHIVNKRLPLWAPRYARALSSRVNDDIVVRKHNRTEWTDDRIELLKTALEAGKSDKQCYELFPGFTETSVRKQRMKLGYRRRALAANFVRVLELAAGHSTMSQIQAEMPHLTGKLCSGSYSDSTESEKMAM